MILSEVLLVVSVYCCHYRPEICINLNDIIELEFDKIMFLPVFRHFYEFFLFRLKLTILSKNEPLKIPTRQHLPTEIIQECNGRMKSFGGKSVYG